MTERIESLRRRFVVDQSHHALRQPPISDPYLLAREFAAQGLSDTERAAERLCRMLREERPVIFPEERIAFLRTVPVIPELHTPEEWEDISKTHYIHERGDVSNINPNYAGLLSVGFAGMCARLTERQAEHLAAGRREQAGYLGVQIRILREVMALADRYREEAERVGNDTVARTLARVPANPPESFLEALQMFRIIHYTLWLSANWHNTVGRFDQYMYPYFQKDMDAGLYTRDTALELVEEFFLTFNRDSDLYPGVQQGDNGQSMVLGGLRPDGSDSYNLLSELCLKASLELHLIDPKINLRVHKNTPAEVYTLGSELTRCGTGFPQYSNDDVVIPALLDWGYAEEDAYNYVVAACWEFIIPEKAMDVPNIGAVSFPRAVEEAVFAELEGAAGYDAFFAGVVRRIAGQVDLLCGKVRNLYIRPAPFVSLMMQPREKDGDISRGGQYNNYGFHGCGLATAADALANIRRYVFGDGSVGRGELIDALQKNFEGYDRLLAKLRCHSPKMGQNDHLTDGIAGALLDAFADALEGRRNDRGGIFRGGTGTAMYYIYYGEGLPATPDGRRKDEPLAANYSPSLFSECPGPVSIIKSFAGQNLRRVMNGGPLTIELHDSVFRGEGSVAKVGALVKFFIDSGGHQLQLNTVNRETLEDAQRHPENYRNLIVRVWGWSGYFVELDREFQEHIMRRMELGL